MTKLRQFNLMIACMMLAWWGGKHIPEPGFYVIGCALIFFFVMTTIISIVEEGN